MKRVWILNHYAQEPNRPGGTRHYSLGTHLVKRGWQVCIIASSVELHSRRQRLEHGPTSLLETIGDVIFLWLKTPTYSGNGLCRVINMLVYTIRALLPSHTKSLPRPDVVIGSSVHPFAALAGALIARRHGVPFVFEVRDLWPQTLIDMGWLSPTGTTTSLLQGLERWLHKRAQKIIVVLPEARNYIVPLGVEAAKIVCIPNGVDLRDFPRPEPAPERPEFTLMYFGAHGSANGLENVVEAVALLNGRRLCRRLKIRLIGDGPRKKSLIDRAKELGLDQISFEDPLPKNKIPDVAAAADGFIFNLADIPVFKYGISSNKLFDFMAAGRPILFCCNSINNPVADAGAGPTVGADDPAALAEAIVQLLSASRAERNAMGHAARVYVERHHSFEELANRLGTVLDELCTPVS